MIPILVSNYGNFLEYSAKARLGHSPHNICKSLQIIPGKYKFMQSETYTLYIGDIGYFREIPS